MRFFHALKHANALVYNLGTNPISRDNRYSFSFRHFYTATHQTVRIAFIASVHVPFFCVISWIVLFYRRRTISRNHTKRVTHHSCFFCKCCSIFGKLANTVSPTIFMLRADTLSRVSSARCQYGYPLSWIKSTAGTPA